MATTVRKHRMASPVTKAWNQAKNLDNSQKLELITLLAQSIQPTLTPPSMKRYTMDEINAMIDQSEADIASGRVYDFDEAMDELEKEFAVEDRELEMVEAV